MQDQSQDRLEFLKPTRGRRRSALVTGSTRGMGLGIATACAEAGFDLMIHGLCCREEIETVRRRLEERYGVQVVGSGADLTHHSEVVAMMTTADICFGGLDVLVNNAELFDVESIEETMPGQWSRMLAANLTAAFHTIRAAVPRMRSRGFGRIINVASALALVGQFACSAYAASKHGILGLTKCVALETAEQGITVNAICPGFVRSPFVESEIRAMAASRGISEDEATAVIVSSAHPTKRFVTATEIGALVVFLASDAAASITGAALPIDGGWTAR